MINVYSTSSLNVETLMAPGRIRLEIALSAPCNIHTDFRFLACQGIVVTIRLLVIDFLHHERKIISSRVPLPMKNSGFSC